MCITKNTELTMQEIAGENTDYNNPIMFKEAQHHEEKKKHMKWPEAINKEIADMTKQQVRKRTNKDQIPEN